MINYPCCPETITNAFYRDNFGDWGFNFETLDWCGLTPYVDHPKLTPEQCWATKLDYKCCFGCVVYSVDEDGEWGFENNEWCGIPSYCKEKEKLTMEDYIIS